MSAKLVPWHRGGAMCWLTGALLLAAVGPAGELRAQVPTSAPRPLPPVEAFPAIPPIPSASSAPAPGPAGEIIQAGCATCGGSSLGAPVGGSGCATCGGGGGCIPGRDNRFCGGWCAETCVGRFLAGFYECICCPDPCYEPRWMPIADSAFFVDAARPVTQMRLRWDNSWNFRHPDRAEYFWARQKTNPAQVSGDPKRRGAAKGPDGIASRVDYSELSLYTEGAAGPAGFFVEIPYRDLDPEAAPAALALDPNFRAMHMSGFADMTIGTKAMLLDCELMQLTLQFKTFIPTGSPGKGLSTGHVSLEPSLLMNLRLTPDTYIQAQLAYWIPIGGDELYQGNIFHFHTSLNRVLWRPCCGLELIGTFEVNEWSVLGGNYTSPDLLVADANGRLSPVALSAETSILSLGPGLRLFICEKIDVGVGTAFAITGSHWAEETVRAEFRWRF